MINTSTGTQVGDTFTVPGSATVEARANATGSRVTLVVTDFDEQHIFATTKVVSINTATGQQIGQTLTLQGELPRPHTASFNADGTRAVFIARDPTGTARAAVFNTTTGTQIGSTITIPGPIIPIAARLTPDGTRATITHVDFSGGQFTTRVSVINTTTGALIGNTVVIPGQSNLPAQFTNDDRRAVLSATSAVFDAATNSLIVETKVAVVDIATGNQIGSTITASGIPYSVLGEQFVRLTPDGRRAIIATFDPPSAGFIENLRVTVVDTTTGQKIGLTVVVPGQLSESVQINAQSTRATFTTNIVDDPFTYTRSSQVLVVNLVTGLPIGAET